MANEDYYDNEDKMKGKKFLSLNSSELYGSSLSKTQVNKPKKHEHKPSKKLPIILNSHIPGSIALQFLRNY